MLAKDIFKGSLMPLVYNLVLQASTCSFRFLLGDQFNKNKKLISFIVGFLSGFASLSTKPKKNRKLWGLFLLSRAIQFIINMLQNKQYLPKSKYTWIVVFVILWIGMGSNFMYEFGNIAPNLFKMYNSYTFKDQQEIDFLNSLNQQKNRELYLNYKRAQPYLSDQYKIRPFEDSVKIFKFQK